MDRRSSTRMGTILTLLGILVACVVLVGGIGALAILPLRNNSGLQAGMEIVKNDPAVAECWGRLSGRDWLQSAGCKASSMAPVSGLFQLPSAVRKAGPG